MTDIDHPDSIPVITDPMGQYWKQPDPSRIAIDSTLAMMSKEDFKMLSEYSCTNPTGVYSGKMWKRNTKTGWKLCWYGPDPDPKFCSNHYRDIVIV